MIDAVGRKALADLDIAVRWVADLVDEKKQLRQELDRIKDYWLCVDGFTMADLMEGRVCDECNMGHEHQEAALAADDGGNYPSLPPWGED